MKFVTVCKKKDKKSSKRESKSLEELCWVVFDDVQKESLSS